MDGGQRRELTVVKPLSELKELEELGGLASKVLKS
jgi:hypothetical protein